MEVLQQEMYKMKRVEARKRLVTTYRETKSIRKTAKPWGTSRLVVRKWVRRDIREEWKGLIELMMRSSIYPFFFRSRMKKNCCAMQVSGYIGTM